MKVRELLVVGFGAGGASRVKVWAWAWDGRVRLDNGFWGMRWGDWVRLRWMYVSEWVLIALVESVGLWLFEGGGIWACSSFLSCDHSESKWLLS